MIWGKETGVAAFTEFRRCLQAEEAHAPAVEPSEACPNSSLTLRTASSLLQMTSRDLDSKPLLVLPGRILCRVRPQADGRGWSANLAKTQAGVGRDH